MENTYPSYQDLEAMAHYPFPVDFQFYVTYKSINQDQCNELTKINQSAQNNN